MSTPRNPDVWVEFTLTKAPTSLGEDTYLWAVRPCADDSTYFDGFKEARITVFGSIERALSDPVFGTYSVAQWRFTANDTDGTIRSLLNDYATSFVANRDVTIRLITEIGRKTGATPRLLARGRTQSVTPTPGRRVEFLCEDILGNEFGVFNLNKTIPTRVFDRETWPELPRELIGVPVPIIYGELNDNGAVDEEGNPAEKGMVPVFYVGKTAIGGEATAPNVIPPPPAPGYTTFGAGGSSTYTYACVVRTEDGGRTTLGTPVTITGLPSPSEFSTSNGVRLTLAEYSAEIQQYVAGIDLYVKDGDEDSTARYFKMDAAGQMFTTFYEDNGDDSHYKSFYPPPPLINTAFIPADDGTEFWDTYVVCGHAASILHVFASNLAEGEESGREEIDPDTNPDFKVPGYAGWTESTDYITKNGQRFTVFYAKGARSLAHINGDVTMAVNVCGVKTNADGTGNTIDQAFRVAQHFISEWVVGNNGKGYYTGDWAGLPTWAPSDATVTMVNPLSFDACETISETRLANSTGYKAAFWLGDPITVGEWMRRFALTFSCFFGVNGNGQIVCKMIDDTASSASGTLLRDRIEVIRLPQMTLAWDEVVTRVCYRYDWDPDATAWRNDEETVEDADAEDAHRGQRKDDILELHYSRDRTTVRDAMARRLLLLKYPPRYQPIETDLSAVEADLGDQIRLSHYDGIEDVERPFFLVRHQIDPMTGIGTLTGLDLSRLLGYATPALEDEAGSVSFVLGDESSTAPPPTGAYQLR
jgi:hypothetical protein